MKNAEKMFHVKHFVDNEEKKCYTNNGVKIKNLKKGDCAWGE